jgi:hypothetical protein
MSSLSRLAFLPAIALTAFGFAAGAPRPKLQFFNGSAQTVDIFWLQSTTERVPNGSVAPGGNTVITTTLGHRFAAVGRDDRVERVVTSEVPVQAMRFDPGAGAGFRGLERAQARQCRGEEPAAVSVVRSRVRPGREGEPGGAPGRCPALGAVDAHRAGARTQHGWPAAANHSETPWPQKSWTAEFGEY